MKQFISKIHLWLSIPFGLIVTVICLSGAALVFEDEATRALHPKLYHVAHANVQPLAPSQLVARVDEQMPDSLHLSSLQLSGQHDETCMVTFHETGRRRLSVDPYTGHVNGWLGSSTMRKLHRWLLDPPAAKGEKSVGKIIVGVSTLCLVVILVSGFILWFPRNRKSLRNRLKITFFNGRRRFYYDCHIALGFYTTLLLLVMALTGLTWSFGWYRTAAYALFGGAQQSIAASENTLKKPYFIDRNGRKTTGKGTADPKLGKLRNEKEEFKFDYSVWDKALTQLTAHYPVYKTILLTQTKAQVVRQSNIRRTDRIAFDPHSARLGDIMRYEDTPRHQRLQAWFYAFHTGSWGGIWTKLLYFLAALIGATLPLTGYYLWWKRYSDRKRTK